MSNAEKERIKKAWEDWLHQPGYFSTKEAFEGGYARGRADALVLPEVRAEELEDLKYYWIVRPDGFRVIDCWTHYDCIGFGNLFPDGIPDGCRIFGPLQMGEGK